MWYVPRGLPRFWGTRKCRQALTHPPGHPTTQALSQAAAPCGVQPAATACWRRSWLIERWRTWVWAATSSSSMAPSGRGTGWVQHTRNTGHLYYTHLSTQVSHSHSTLFLSCKSFFVSLDKFHLEYCEEAFSLVIFKFILFWWLVRWTEMQVFTMLDQWLIFCFACVLVLRVAVGQCVAVSVVHGFTLQYIQCVFNDDIYGLFHLQFYYVLF